MKAILVLIVVVGSMGSSNYGDQRVQVREIEFSSIDACRKAAVQMVSASRGANDRARTFDVDRSNGRVLVPGPVVIAECLEL
ncbi:MAG: hypothetical protein QNJ67_03950 [Kiloniellales bacterium]|nr:hypothetical protein [Kiloniellales bacterium]